MKTKTTAKIEAQFTLQLSEDEAGALDALAGYGADAFLKVFYKYMGEHYMRPHEAGLRSLFATIGGLRYGLQQSHKARRVFHGQEQAPAITSMVTIQMVNVPQPWWAKVKRFFTHGERP